MRKFFTFILLAAALLVSVESWAYVTGEEKDFEELGLPLIEPDLHGTYFGTICVPQRIVATQGIRILDVVCVDVRKSDSTKVVRLVVDVHSVCSGAQQGVKDDKGETLIGAEDIPFCPYDQGTGANTCVDQTYIDWIDIDTGWDDVHDRPNPGINHRMVAGAAYFYQVCDGDGGGTAAKTLADRKIWVDKNDSASAPVCVNGFYGTFEQTNLNEPVIVLTQSTLGEQKTQYLEQVTQVTMPANRGYFKGYFECVPWRYNTDIIAEDPNPHPSSAPNPLHYPCTGEVKEAPLRLSPNAVAFNVGPRDAVTGLYQIDFEHPIYLGRESNKRIENGQLIVEAADGSIYNAFGQRVR